MMERENIGRKGRGSCGRGGGRGAGVGGGGAAESEFLPLVFTKGRETGLSPGCVYSHASRGAASRVVRMFCVSWSFVSDDNDESVHASRPIPSPRTRQRRHVIDRRTAERTRLPSPLPYLPPLLSLPPPATALPPLPTSLLYPLPLSGPSHDPLSLSIFTLPSQMLLILISYYVFACGVLAHAGTY